MTDITREHSDTVVSRIREITEAVRSNHIDGYPPITFSVGIAFSEHGYSDEILGRADKALYFTKDQGRNGYTFYEDDKMMYHGL